MGHKSSGYAMRPSTWRLLTKQRHRDRERERCFFFFFFCTGTHSGSNGMLDTKNAHNSRAISESLHRQINVHEATCDVRKMKIIEKKNCGFKHSIESRSLSGGGRQVGFQGRRRKSVFGAKLSCHHNRADFSVSSSPSPPLSASFISVSFPDSVSVGIQQGMEKKKKRLTMMTKVTGPMKLHMKWLSTLSQHLGQGDTMQNQTKPKSTTSFSRPQFFFGGGN